MGRIKQRQGFGPWAQVRGSAADLAAANPILAEGETGIELGSPIKFKIGDGITAWNALPYGGGGPVPSGGGNAAYRLGPFKISAFDGQAIIIDTNTTVSGGTFTVTYPGVGGQTTPQLDWNISAAALKTALENLSTIGAGKVKSVTGTDVNTGYVVMFEGAFMTEVVTLDGSSLTGPDAPYNFSNSAMAAWTTALFTPLAGDTILDFSHSIKTAFDSPTAVLAYCDNPNYPFTAGARDGGFYSWSSAGDSDLFDLKLDDVDLSPANLSGWAETKSDPGYQRSAVQAQIAYWIAGVDKYSTLPVEVINSIPIYAAVKGVGNAGEVWIWVDIAPATAP